MFKTFVTSEEDYRSFMRPAIYDSLREVLKFYHLDSSAQIFYNGENEIAKLVGSNSSDDVTAGQYTDGVYRDKLFIVPDIQRAEFERGYSNQRRQMTERPVWWNKDEEPLMFYPVFEGVKVTVQVVAAFNSRMEAENMIKRINRLQANQMADFNFSPTVHLVVNNCILELLENVHTLLTKNDPATPPLGDWFDKYCQVPFTTIMNPIGNHQRIVVPMKLENKGIQFTEAFLAQSRKGATYGKFEVEFSYSFNFSEFTGWDLEYPLNIYQDEIDQKWIPRPNEQWTKPFNVRTFPELALIQNITKVQTFNMPYYLRLPAHDIWEMEKWDWVQPIVQARLTVADVAGQELVNFLDIPNYTWNEAAKNYILRRHDVAFRHHDTPFLFYIFSDDLRIDPTQLSMDANGAISLSRQPTMRNTHRVVVTIDYAIRDYSDAFWDDLRQHPEDWPLIKDLFPGFPWDKLPEPWINHVIDIIKGIDKGNGIPVPNFNRYMSYLSLTAFNILEAH